MHLLQKVGREFLLKLYFVSVYVLNLIGPQGVLRSQRLRTLMKRLAVRNV